MKPTLFAAVAVLALSLGGCSTFGLPGSSASQNAAAWEAVNKIITDPNCAHHDEARAVIGAAGIPASASVVVSRDCPARPAT